MISNPSLVHQPLSSHRSTGFTLIELLTVISIIGILSSLLLPALTGAKWRAKRIACLNHIKRFALASLMYSHDDRTSSLSGRTAREDQNVNWLLPYIGSTNLFSCPATRNFIRPDQGRSPWTGHKGYRDLMVLADTRAQVAGSSYIGYGFFAGYSRVGMSIPFNGTRLRIRQLRRNAYNIRRYQRKSPAYGLQGRTVGPAEHWIFLDNNGADRPFIPDAGDNHGEAGGNVGFCDGHGEWIRQSEYHFRQELSQDANLVRQ